jgi:hypothetical protein
VKAAADVVTEFTISTATRPRRQEPPLTVPSALGEALTVIVYSLRSDGAETLLNDKVHIAVVVLPDRMERNQRNPLMPLANPP